MEYLFKAQATIAVNAPNKTAAKKGAADLMRQMKANANSHTGISPDSNYVASARSVKPCTSAADLRKHDIRVESIFILENARDTHLFSCASYGESLCGFFNWLLWLDSPKGSASFPGSIIEQFAPLIEIVKEENCKNEMAGHYTAMCTLERAVTLADFGFIVHVTTPIRQYFPDGDYESSWVFKQSVYGHGETYEDALTNAVSHVVQLRKSKVV
jgi:hypothetical protein